MKTSEKQVRDGKVHPIKCRVSKNKKRQEGLLQGTVHKTRRKEQKGRLEISSGTSREHSTQRRAK